LRKSHGCVKTSASHRWSRRPHRSSAQAVFNVLAGLSAIKPSPTSGLYLQGRYGLTGARSTSSCAMSDRQ
jgi:hypothetical protein